MGDPKGSRDLQNRGMGVTSAATSSWLSRVMPIGKMHRGLVTDDL
jgi:hypothetical protein